MQNLRMRRDYADDTGYMARLLREHAPANLDTRPGSMLDTMLRATESVIPARLTPNAEAVSVGGSALRYLASQRLEFRRPGTLVLPQPRKGELQLLGGYTGQGRSMFGQHRIVSDPSIPQGTAYMLAEGHSDAMQIGRLTNLFTDPVTLDWNHMPSVVRFGNSMGVTVDEDRNETPDAYRRRLRALLDRDFTAPTILDEPITPYTQADVDFRSSLLTEPGMVWGTPPPSVGTGEADVAVEEVPETTELNQDGSIRTEAAASAPAEEPESRGMFQFLPQTWQRINRWVRQRGEPTPQARPEVSAAWRELVDATNRRNEAMEGRFPTESAMAIRERVAAEYRERGQERYDCWLCGIRGTQHEIGGGPDGLCRTCRRHRHPQRDLPRGEHHCQRCSRVVPSSLYVHETQLCRLCHRNRSTSSAGDPHCTTCGHINSTVVRREDGSNRCESCNNRRVADFLDEFMSEVDPTPGPTPEELETNYRV